MVASCATEYSCNHPRGNPQGWRGETDTLEKMVQRVAHDIEYIRRFSLLFDVQIIARTVFGRETRQNAY